MQDKESNLNNSTFSVEKKGKKRNAIRIICNNKNQATFALGYKNKKYVGYILNFNYESLACAINGNFDFDISNLYVVMVVNIDNIKCKLFGRIKIMRTLMENIPKWKDIYILQYDKYTLKDPTLKDSVTMIHNFIDQLVKN